MRTLRPLLIALAAAFAFAPLAGAQGAKPVPGCAGLQIEDPAGDVSVAAGPTATNLDITGGFFLTSPTGEVTANMMVADMSLMPPPPATAVTWYTTYVVGETTHFVDLEADVTGATVFEYGVLGENAAGGLSYQPAGETKGTVYEGPDGLISIVVPKGAKGQPGQLLATPKGESFQLVQNTQGGGVLLFGDDTAEGFDYRAGSCDASGTTPPSVTPPATPPKPVEKLAISLVSRTAKAGRSVAVKLKSTGDVTQVGARLRKGRTILGTGRLASIAAGRTGTVKLKLRRKPRKGGYTLDVTGRDATGSLSSATFKIKLR